MWFLALHYKLINVHIWQKINQFISICREAGLSNAHLTFFNSYLQSMHLLECLLDVD